MPADPPTTIVCPHCGDTTQQEMVLDQFTCGACDEPFSPPGPTTDIRWHDLKTWPEQWQAVFDGRKTFEVRRDDRGFAVGDALCLQEWNPETEQYTGRQCFRTIKHILTGGQFGIEPGYVVMGIK